MPYYRQNYWKRRWRRRPRRRYFRGPFRRRYWRRHRVRLYSRKRKLSKIKIQEWQPEKIVKTTIKGIYPLFICNKDRISNNLIQFLDSTAPQDFPGGGGFSIMQFTLQALYNEFIQARNWWTKSNCLLPLVRYIGVGIKFYRTEKFDYLVQIHRCYPLAATDELYMSTQPSIMALTKRCIFVPCRQNTNNKKPYKKVWIKPPTQMTTGWHFQKDICNFPFLILTATATSFDRWYVASNTQSTTIGFTSLNTQIFQLHDWQDPPTTGYHPAENLYLWGAPANSPENPEEVQVGDLIYLGGTGKEDLGTSIKTHSTSYSTNKGYWGNIFHIDYLTHTNHIYKTTKNCKDFVESIKNNLTQKVKDNQDISTLNIPLLVECRYNPFNDRSKNNKVYVVSNHTDHTKWQPPPDKPDVLRENLPLWLANWGYADWMRKAKLVSQVDINYILVWQSNYILSTPPLTYYVPLDQNFINHPQTSPYIQHLNPSDTLHLYPKLTFQIITLNTMCSTGPGTIKLDKNQAAEAKMLYKFKLKLGGCPAPMETLCNPTDQPKYPIPNFKQQTPSLQNPGNCIQTYLYNFDERRGLITKKAAKRIKKDSQTETDAFQITGTSMDLPTPHQSPPTEDPSSSEEEEETTFQLLKLRYQQQQLRKRILHLITQNIE